MKLAKRSYLSGAAERRVVEAIRMAEQGNRGEVRVHLEARYPGDGPRQRAAELFETLGVGETRDGTGVLLYVAVDDRKAAIWAGPGIYGAADPSFWQDAIDKVAEGFRVGDPDAGLVEALEVVGELLRSEVPGEDTAGNELANEVTTS